MIPPNNFWWLSRCLQFSKQIWVVPLLNPSKVFSDHPFWVLSYDLSPLLFSQKASDSPQTPPPPPLNGDKKGIKKWPVPIDASHHWSESWFVTFQGSGEYHWLYYQYRWHKLLQRWKWKIWLWQVKINFDLINFLHHSIVFNGLSLSVNGRAGHWGRTGCHSSK